jgi:hypothetical protein
MANVWAPEVHVERDRITWAIVDRVWLWFLESAVFVPGLLADLPSIAEIAHQWTWPPLPELDATEAASAAATRLSTGQSTLSEEHARRGKDWEMEAARAAADFGVSVEEYKRAVFAKTFGLQPASPAMAPASSQASTQAAGEYTTIGQRAFSNNQKRIRRALDELTEGTASRAFTEQTLASIGLSTERITALIDDALEDEVTDDELSEIEAAASLKAAGKYDGIDFTPPAGVRSEAKKGLEWRREYNRGGTAVGVARARNLSNGDAMSPDTIGRMVSYFARHEVDKKGQGWSPGEDGFPSAGRIAWALWGGDAGAAWAGKVGRQMDARDEE